ncbi:hypothetical protein JA1_005374 [Spathaspora sp. JA1]|nr:hypothetical protein JA1_005374 [Spathaspora sp. JA1]
MSSFDITNISKQLSDVTTKRRVVFLVLGICLSGFILSIIPSRSYTISTNYQYVPSLKSESYSKIIHKDPEYTKYTYQVKSESHFELSKEEPSVLILSTIDGYGNKRSIKDFVHTISSLIEHQQRSYQISLGFLCTETAELNKIIKYVESNSESLSNSFKRITLISAPSFLTKETKTQLETNSVSARLKNFLISNTLDLETYTIFIHPHVKSFNKPDSIISTFINSHQDINVPRIQKGKDVDHDKNSWSGKRTKPTKEQLSLMDENKWDAFDYVPSDTDTTYHFQNYLNEEEEQHKDDYGYSVKLDAVGGYVIFVKSIIYKQGILFPNSNVVGTNWDRLQGYDGVETQGFCYMANALGYQCWGMPNMVAYLE